MAGLQGEGGRQHTRVVVVDDYYTVRVGIAYTLKTAHDIELVGEAADGEEALRVCEEARPDVVIMDLKLPKMDGISATRELRRRHPEIQVLALTAYLEDESVLQALEAGAIGYLLKNVDLDVLIDAIRAAHRGQLTLSQEASQALVRATTNGPLSKYAAPHGTLTEREGEVLKLVVDGLTNQQIAHRLALSEATVKYHMRHLFTKLGVTTRTELVAVALHHRLLK